MNPTEYKNSYEHSFGKDLKNTLYYLYYFAYNRLFNSTEYDRGCQLCKDIHNVKIEP